MKTCCRCGEEKALEEFYRQSKARDGLSPRCKACDSSRQGFARRPPITKENFDVTMSAYLAGLLDGEGYIGIVKSRRKVDNGLSLHAKVVIALTTPQIVSLQKKYGVGKVFHSESKNSKHKDRFDWVITSNQIRWLLPQIEPHLVVKQRQARLLLDYLALARHKDKSIGYRAAVIDIYKQLRQLNHRGRL